MKKYLFFTLLLLACSVYAMKPIVLIADPEILAIPIHENNEAMVDLTKQHDIALGPPPIVATNRDYTKMRKTVYQKLKQAQSKLPKGLKFQLYEGHRTLALQQAIFDERYEKIRKAYPKLSHEAVFKTSTKFVSPVTNLDGSKNIPPHSTGAAIDVYLIDDKGHIVDMGILLDETYKDIDGHLCQTDSNAISEQAKEYRQIMSNALLSVGFVNYPTEYWHWSYGDRYWAYHTKQPHAIYGSR